eukprot:COSAG04_NODE_18077_length_451_cov_1.215909_1_plen_38_part_01
MLNPNEDELSAEARGNRSIRYLWLDLRPWVGPGWGVLL